MLILGALCGATLYHAAFGFTPAYRQWLFHRDGAGVRAQLVMLGVASALFVPALAAGSVFGQPVAGALAPVGWQVAIGAFLFGIGMQLGNGCASGTLYSLGGGSLRMGLTLAAFCGGGFAASLHMDAWQRLPDAGNIALGELIGWPEALLLQFGLLALAYGLVKWWERPVVPSEAADRTICYHLLVGPWPLLSAAIALALLNFLTLVVSGHPWTITWAFTLWAAKFALLTGWDSSSSPFWTGTFQEHALRAPVLEDETSVMNMGILLGALIAAALAGRFAPSSPHSGRSLLSALIGGIMMGYGARLAYGCNIGAFISGIASTSLHGWLWIAAALPGTWIGAKLRPAFRLTI